MRIVLDMQGAQTESRFRGIGRYTFSLAQAIARKAQDHEVHLFLNGAFIDTIAPLREAFADLIPDENIHVWVHPFPIAEGYPPSEWRRDASELVREAFLLNLHPDIVHIFSMFEGFADDQVSSVAAFTPSLPSSVTQHDLIPLIHADIYLKRHPAYEKHYMRKLEFLKNATVCLSNSEYTAQESRALMGMSADQIINVSAGGDALFQKVAISATNASALRDRFKIRRHFLMYTGGADRRKNLHALIQSFALLDPAIRSEHQLLIVGKLSDAEMSNLNLTAKQSGLQQDELLFTGYIQDQDLVALYNLCKLFVFPSVHEGFGLPALEAMLCGAPVIGSNTTSLPEIIGNPNALFDPHSNQSIADLITKVLTDDSFRQDLIEKGFEQAKKFSWDFSAKKAIEVFERIHQSHQCGKYLQSDLIESIAQLPGKFTDKDLKRLAWAIDMNGL